MRSLVRIAAPVLAAVAIVLGGSSSALAASRNPAVWAPPPASAPSSSWDLDAAWCFDDVVLQYCFDISGKAQFLDTATRSSVVTNQRFHTVVFQGGVQVAESTVVSHDLFSTNADGEYTQQVVEHTRSVYGDETCSIQIVWRQADFRLVVDHWSGGCS